MTKKTLRESQQEYERYGEALRKRLCGVTDYHLGTDSTLRDHQQKAGRSRSPKKVAAVTKNLEKAWAVKRKNLSQKPSAIYQRARRARMKEDK